MLVTSASDRDSRLDRWLSAAPGVFGLLLWSLLVLALDVLLVGLVTKNLLAQRYPSVLGEITHHDDPRDVGRGAAPGRPESPIRFRYTVHGQEFSGTRLHFLNLRDVSHPAKTQQTMQRFAIGRQVEVFYNPADPSDSALERSFNGMPLAFALFLVPFHVLMVGGWIWLSRRVNGTRSLPLRRDGDRWCLLSTNGQPGIVAMTIAGVASLALLVVVGIGGWSDDWRAMLVIWGILLGASGLAYGHTRSLVQRETPVLILNDALATVTWPPTGDAPEFSVARTQLLRVEIGEPTPPDADTVSSLDFSIRLHFTDDDGQPQQRFVIKSNDAAEVASLAEWLESWTNPHSN